MRNSAFIISALMHVSIVLLAFLQWQTNSVQPKLGMTQEEILPSYIYQPVAPTKPVTIQPKIIPKAIAINKTQQTPTQKAVQTPAKAQDKFIGNNKQLPALLALLHAAIEQQKQYPPAAVEMEREGTVTLTFILYTDGTIQNLQIAKSSGTSSLDTAALTAVKQAVPFKNINKYLHQPQNYQIDVVFELA